MKQLITIREYIKAFVSKYENYVRPCGKFLLTFITLLVINSKLGFASRLSNGAIVLIISLIASFLPLNFIPVVAMLIVLLHTYALSTVAAIVVAVVIFLMFLLYFRFSPKDTILLVFTPLLFVMKVPYVMPLVAGLVSTPLSIITVGCGTIAYYLLSFIATNADAIKAMENAEILEKLQFYLDEIIYNKEMYVVVMAFGITIVVVSVIRRLAVDYAWDIAIVTGCLTDIVVILVGDLKFGTYISVGGVIFCSLLGIIVTEILKFFVFSLDYAKTEKVQFEDDEYYYFVKAVPKHTYRRIREEGYVKTSSPSHSSKSSHSSHNKDTERKKESNRSSSRSSSRREIIEDDVTEYVPKRHMDDDIGSYRKRDEGLSSIERAAAAKARANRQNSKK